MSTPNAQRMIWFRLDRHAYAIPAEEVDGVASLGAVRKVHGAPADVLGLVELRGGLVCVLDLPRLLGDRSGDGPPCVIRLRAPREGLALYVPAKIRIATVTLTDEQRSRKPVRFVHEERTSHLIDVGGLLESFEMERSA